MFLRSWVRISKNYTEWNFFTYISYKNCNVCLKRRNKWKRGRRWPILKNKDNEIDSVYSDQTESEYQAYRLLTNHWEV